MKNITNSKGQLLHNKQQARIIRKGKAGFLSQYDVPNDPIYFPKRKKK